MARGDGIRAYHKCAREAGCKGIGKRNRTLERVRESVAARQIQQAFRRRQERQVAAPAVRRSARDRQVGAPAVRRSTRARNSSRR